MSDPYNFLENLEDLIARATTAAEGDGHDAHSTNEPPPSFTLGDTQVFLGDYFEQKPAPSQGGTGSPKRGSHKQTNIFFGRRTKQEGPENLGKVVHPDGTVSYPGQPDPRRNPRRGTGEGKGRPRGGDGTY